jgi:hypothetical protein
VAQSFDPGQTTDTLYLDDPRAVAFVRIDAALYDAINGGAIRL